MAMREIGFSDNALVVHLEKAELDVLKQVRGLKTCICDKPDCGFKDNPQVGETMFQMAVDQAIKISVMSAMLLWARAAVSVKPTFPVMLQAWEKSTGVPMDRALRDLLEAVWDPYLREMGVL